MINAFHALIYSADAEADRAFFRDILRFPYVDAHDGWLIFELPPAELGIHPDERGGRQELHLMCDDVDATVAELQAKGVEIVSPVVDQGYGLVTSIRLPGGGELGLYQPAHATPLKNLATANA